MHETVWSLRGTQQRSGAPTIRKFSWAPTFILQVQYHCSAHSRAPRRHATLPTSALCSSACPRAHWSPGTSARGCVRSDPVLCQLHQQLTSPLTTPAHLIMSTADRVALRSAMRSDASTSGHVRRSRRLNRSRPPLRTGSCCTTHWSRSRSRRCCSCSMLSTWFLAARKAGHLIGTARALGMTSVFKTSGLNRFDAPWIPDCRNKRQRTGGGAEAGAGAEGGLSDDPIVLQFLCTNDTHRCTDADCTSLSLALLHLLSLISLLQPPSVSVLALASHIWSTARWNRS